jgi:hypothetical protein
MPPSDTEAPVFLLQLALERLAELSIYEELNNEPFGKHDQKDAGVAEA